MSIFREEIKDFVLKLQEKAGTLPKWNYSKTPNKLYYNTPFMDDSETVSFIETFLFSKWAAAGEKVKEFEDEFSKSVNNKYTIAVSSGSDANLIMISALKEYYNWADNSNVLCSISGFPTTYSALIYNNLDMNLVDIESISLNFDLDKLEKQINDKTVAIFISPPLGNLPNLDRLIEIAKKYNLIIINDGCDSLSCSYKGKQFNEYGVATTCSLYMAHHVSTISGGTISTDNKKIADICRSLSRWGHGCFCRSSENLLPDGKCGVRFSKWIPQLNTVQDHKYTYFRPGFNSQLLDCQGAMGLEQLKKLPLIHQKRKESKNRVQELFNKYLPELSFIEQLPDTDISWFGTCLICPNKEFKNKLVNFLESNGVQTRYLFGSNILTQPGFQKYGNYLDYPVANDILYRLFFVGANPNWDEEDFQFLEKVLKLYD
jgi:CDP-6-deoxy-D-xylo-4-hexulose-3-dehydrase